MPGWHDVGRYPVTTQVPGLLIIRWSAPLFFANANQFRGRIRAAVRSAAVPPRWVLIAAEPISDIDITASKMLVDLDAELIAGGILLTFAEVQSAVRDWITRYEILDMSHGTRSFASVKEAVDAFHRATADGASPGTSSEPVT
jgi:MFS superfamily sulfate permease-like transporter